MKLSINFLVQLTLRLFLLLTALLVLAWCIISKWWYGLLLIPLIIWQFVRLINFNRKTIREFEQFTETIRFHDFSRRFDTKHGPKYIRKLHAGFNEISDTITAVNREKEMQYRYLQQIIELVDTGIISYRTDTDEVLWMNRSLKELLNIPSLKNFNTLSQRNPALFEQLQSLIGDGHGAVISVTTNAGSSKVLVSGGTFIMENTEFRLFAFRNVNEALDEAESKAWQRLLSVMTHEIMNSVAPISSLAETLKNLLERAKNNPIDSDEIIEDIEPGIETIRRRSEGLLTFAETYRNLSKITELNISNVQISTLFEHIYRLMLPSLSQKNIELEMILKDPLMTIDADASLIEQVLINLIVNAIDAVKEKTEPHIILSAGFTQNKRPILKVIDNGKGIPEEILDKIFIPFFSTRKSGNGIGLSLCKQIMMLHKGNVQVQSIEGEETCFCLLF